MKQEVFVEQLGKLVEFKTLPGQIETNKEALDFVQELLDPEIYVERFVNGKAEVLIASVKGGMKHDICYMVHMDVVAGKDNQFELVMDGDKLVGRGTCDMKFSIPIGVALLNEAKEKELDLALVVTTDEEVGGLEGAKYLREIRGYSPKMLIVPDGGENLNFVDKAKGVCQISVVAKGRPAHASRPWLGVNALDGLTKLGERLLRDYGESNKHEGWMTTMNIGYLHGGESTNQVCPSAEMKLDFRYPETDSIEKILNKVKDHAKEIGAEFEINIIGSGLPTFTDVNDERVVKYLKVMSDQFGREIRVQPTYGASDARHFADLNIPVLMHKPLGGEIHSDYEWISLESSLKFYQGLRTYLGLK